MRISYKDLLESETMNNGWLFVIYDDFNSEIHLNLIKEDKDNYNEFPLMNISLKEAVSDTAHKIMIFD